MDEQYNPMPVAGYRSQSRYAIDEVNENKELEEVVLRRLDAFAKGTDKAIDKRWLAIGRTHIEQGFMAVNRAIFQPERVKVPQDDDYEIL